MSQDVMESDPRATTVGMVMALQLDYEPAMFIDAQERADYRSTMFDLIRRIERLSGRHTLLDEYDERIEASAMVWEARVAKENDEGDCQKYRDIMEKKIRELVDRLDGLRERVKSVEQKVRELQASIEYCRVAILILGTVPREPDKKRSHVNDIVLKDKCVKCTHQLTEALKRYKANKLGVDATKTVCDQVMSNVENLRAIIAPHITAAMRVFNTESFEELSELYDTPLGLLERYIAVNGTNDRITGVLQSASINLGGRYALKRQRRMDRHPI